uniref:Uncharacterized protein n=1 Tax=Anguilla anguilla TaxID=7936 RepID=A0A0E9PCH7_ANGAN
MLSPTLFFVGKRKRLTTLTRGGPLLNV